MIGPEKRMKKRLKEYEEKGMRKSPFRYGRYRRNLKTKFTCEQF